MANGKVAGYRLELRMAIADGLINGREFEDIRDYLREAGLPEADLPSDHSIRTFQESVEYDMMYRRRVEAVELRMTAGSLAGVVASRVEILQEQALEKLGRWMDAGLVESTDIFKALAFTLQYQRQALAGRKLRADLGERELPEPLGPPMVSKARLDAVMAKFAAEEAAAMEAADERVAAEEELDEAERVARILEDSGYARLPTDDEDDASIAQDNAGSARIAQDSTRQATPAVTGQAAVAARDAVADPESAGVRGVREHAAGSARIVEDNAGSARIAQDSTRQARPAVTGQAAVAARDAVADPESAGVWGVREHAAGSARIVEDNAGSESIAEEAELLAATGTDDAAGGWFAGASFRNSPSAATRAKARSKRKKRRR